MAYEDARDWPEYNGRLVRRGEFYLTFDFLDSWYDELEIMNQGKCGNPFVYPESFIQFAGLIYTIFRLPYRQLEGYLRKLSSFIPRLKAADYTMLWHRIGNLDLDIRVPDEEIVVAALRCIVWGALAPAKPLVIPILPYQALL